MNPLTILLTVNSILSIGLILNQNENVKDALSMESSRSSPIEQMTWACLFVQIILLLVKIKNTDF